MAQKMCLQRGLIGDTKRFMQGYILSELLLWLFFLLPGLIYSIWRHSTVAQVCSRCESPNVIPLDNPVARNLLANQPKARTPVGQPASEVSNNRMSPKKALVIAGVLVAFVVLIFARLSNSTGQSTSGTTAPTVSSAIAPVTTKPKIAAKRTGNEANDRLLAVSNGDQALMRSAVVGEGCVGNRTFYMVISKERSAFWSVGCADGNSYEVMIDSNSVGSTKILD